MELANEDATMEMEHRTTYLATVGTLGPMIGLVGTVYGMIMAFQVIALEGQSPQASQLAAGISTALYATLEGIAISIPAIFFYAMLPQSDRPAVTGGGDDGRALARAVRAGRAARRRRARPPATARPRRHRPTLIPSLSVRRSRPRGAICATSRHCRRRIDDMLQSEIPCPHVADDRQPRACSIPT